MVSTKINLSNFITFTKNLLFLLNLSFFMLLGHKKSAKLVRAGKLIAKPLKHGRRSGKLLEDIPVAEEEIIEEVLDQLPEEEILELAAEEIAHEIEGAVEAREAPAHHGAQYFNTHFGDANEGTIALANSYSTGANGHSQSHATSYGANHAAHAHAHTLHESHHVHIA